MNLTIRSIILFILCVLFHPVSFSIAERLDLNLNDCIDLSLKNNTQILLMEQEKRMADKRIVEARAGALPKIKASGKYERIDESITFSGIDIGNEDNFEVNLGLEQPFYVGGKVRSALKIADIYKDYSEIGQRGAENQVVYKTKEGYYTILFLRELVKIRQESVELLEEHLDITKKKFNVGLASNFEVLRAEVELANARPPLIKAKNQLTIAKDSFKRLLGLDYTANILLQGELAYTDGGLFSLEESIEIAKNQHPDLKKQKFVIDMNKENLNIAKGGYKPQVFLYANYWGVAPQFGSSEIEWDWGWNAGVMAEIPIFEGFAVKSRVDQSSIEIKKAEISYDDLIEEVKLRVRSSLHEIQEAKERVLSQKKNVQQAMEGLRIAETRYKNEVSPQIEVMDARVALTAAKVNYFQAVFDYKTAYAGFELAIGKVQQNQNEPGNS
ncbi:MAG: TolC family protein [Thermodesulfobacteriota bacterium]|nr:TolC family protein [Thermodesulfobacteriota bacterium]